MAAPWDRLPAETLEAYSRFLRYRNLGPRRSFRKAYLHYLQELDGYRGGLTGLHVPGQWREDARDHFWAERANAWDVRNLAAYGSRVAVLHALAVEKVARKNLTAAGHLRPGDDGWADLMASLKVVAQFLSPELVRGIESRNQSARQPAPAAAPGDDPDR